MSAVVVLVDIGRGARESFSMFWDTLWALVLGFGLSGAVQAFVSRAGMKRRLGDHRPAAVARASVYGAVSSSCSYAASAMAKSMFAQGADFLASMVFMFASTNLVVELGIVLAVLIGWQFVAAEFIGGAIMVVLLVVAGGLWFRGRALDEARRTAGADSAKDSGAVHGTAVDADYGDAHDAGDDSGTVGSHAAGAGKHDDASPPARGRIRTLAGWSDAAGYTMSDLTMLRREMAIGFVVAGFLAALVPNHVWSDVFVHGHGFSTTLENVVVGPFVAIISFVCSIGNVPLAAALWKGGISFGGVVSFIFADLIAMPLLLIYRKQYGRRMALRMLGVFWLVMSVSGLVTEELFRALGWVPAVHPSVIAAGAFGLNVTSGLDVVAIAVFGLLYLLYKKKDRFGPGVAYGKDPVCGMQVEVANAPACALHEGHRVYFCSERCRDKFSNDPERYMDPSEPSGRYRDAGRELAHQPARTDATDPVCGMAVDPATATVHRSYEAREHWFCCEGCAANFDADPAAYDGADDRTR